MARFGKRNRVDGRKRRGNAKGIAGRIALVVIALAICAIPPVFVNDAIGYLPLLALVIVLVLSFVYLQVLKRSLSYSEESLVPSCERGTEIEFVLNFKNSSPLLFLRLEPHIYISDLFDGVDTITPVSMPLMPFENRDFKFKAQFDHIGTYSAGVKEIVINDLLGLFTHTFNNPNRHHVEVLPRIVDLETLPLTSTASAESRKPLQTLVTDDLDYAGVRDYQWGDPLKNIHWKLSSRLSEGDYLTRLFETFNNPGIEIIVDTASPDYDADSLMYVFDGIVEGALSINQYALSRGLDSALTFKDKYGADSKIRISNRLEFATFTNVLPRIHAGDGTDALELLRREGNRIHGQDNVAYCSAHVDESVISALLDLKLHKRNPLFLLVVPPSLEGETLNELVRPLKRLDAGGISYYVLSGGVEELQGGVD